ncbi:MAG: hypothetical protein RMY28_009445 [Nostoc sp. ChiSLP01]|nr:hypothetical protein [Nostoc sp. CmiSLP01]MDZ8285221.1 hypothetical protein [Nostoc sp. ChiSLP01]
MTYTIAKVAEPWTKLFPKIKENPTNIELTLRGQTFAIEIPKKRSQITSTKNLELR